MLSFLTSESDYKVNAKTALTFSSLFRYFFLVIYFARLSFQLYLSTQETRKLIMSGDVPMVENPLTGAKVPSRDMERRATEVLDSKFSFKITEVKDELEKRHGPGGKKVDTMVLNHLREIDNDGNGTITLWEVITLLEKLERSKMEFNIQDVRGAIMNKYQDGSRNISNRDKETISKLSKMDVDGDGTIELSEILNIEEKFEVATADKKKLQYAFAAVLVLFFAFVGITLGLNVAANELSKETKMSGNSMRTKNGKQMVATENPRAYSTLLDLPKLPPKALNSLNELSFVTKDGVSHSYKVDGTRSNAKHPNAIYIEFGLQGKLHIYNTSADFTHTTLAGKETITPVIVTDTTARRRALFANHFAADPNHEIMTRCSVAKGFCFHTYDEIVQLNTPLTGERRLSDEEDTITYAEIGADMSILDYADPAIAQAGSFLAAMFGPGMIDGVSDTVTMKFLMKERCENYPQLADRCKTTPAMDTDSGASPDIVEKFSPFHGLSPSDSKWVFADEIEYSKDKYSTRLRVRYAHDVLRDYRTHVILQDISNPSRIVTYDEIIIQNEDMKLETKITNYDDQNVEGNDPTISGDSAVDGQKFQDGGSFRRRLQHQVASDIFHAHVRTKIAGFPTLTFHDALVGVTVIPGVEGKPHSLPDHVARRLAEDGEEILVVDTQTTVENVAGSLYIGDNYTDAEAMGLVDNGTMFEEDFNAEITQLPAPMNVSSETPDLEEPTCTFEEVDLVLELGTIIWPTKSEVVEIAQFKETPVDFRSQMLEMEQTDTWYVNASSGENVTTLATTTNGRRRLLEEESDRDLSNGIRILKDSLSRLVDHIDIMQESRIADAEGVEDDSDFVHFVRGRGRRLRRRRRRRRRKRSRRARRRNRAGGKKAAKAIETPAKAAAAQASNGLSDPPTYSGYTPKLGEKFKVDEANAAFRSSFAVAGSPLPTPTAFTQGTWAKYTPRTGCKEMKKEVVRTNEHIDVFVGTVVPAISSAITTIQSSLADLVDLRTALGLVQSVQKALQTVMPALSKIPYAGPVLKVVGKAMKKLVDKVVKPVKEKIEKLEAKIAKAKVNPRLTTINTKALEISKYVEMVQDQLTESSHQLILADSLCPRAASKDTCDGIKSTLRKPNDRLDVAKVAFKQFGVFAKSFDKTMAKVSGFTTAKVWKKTKPVLEAMDEVVSKLEKFMKKKFKVCIPLFCTKCCRERCWNYDYPCGTKTCKKKVLGKKVKYPCGVKTCSARTCVDEPWTYSCDKCTSTSVKKILNKLSDGPLFELMEKGAKALGIELPTPKLPGVPSVKELNYIMDSIDGELDGMDVVVAEAEDNTGVQCAQNCVDNALESCRLSGIKTGCGMKGVPACQADCAKISLKDELFQASKLILNQITAAALSTQCVGQSSRL
jgi:hypothetical protein